MTDSDTSIERREQLSHLPEETERLWVSANAFEKPLDAEELRPLSRLKNLLEVSLNGFSFSPAKLLDALAPDYVWKLILYDFPVMDQGVLASLTTFRKVSDLTLSGYKSLPATDYDWACLSNWSNLVTLDLSGNPGFAESFLNALPCSKLLTLTLRVDALTDSLWNVLVKFEKLEQVWLHIERFAVDIAKAARLPHLTHLWIFTTDPKNGVALRRWGIEQGLARLVRTKGRIGDWYETGKEQRTREFLPEDGFSDNRPFALGPGEELKIIDPAGASLFDGPLIPENGEFSGTWTQAGVAADLWEKWFISDLRAKLVAFSSIPGKQFVIVFQPTLTR